MRSVLFSLLLLVSAIAACGKTTSGDNSASDEWEDVKATDTAVVIEAKRACNGRPRREDTGSTPGGSDPFTSCMKQKANAVFGSPAFHEICTAIPGAHADPSSQSCVTFDL